MEPVQGCKKVFVGGLGQEVTDEHLREYFQTFGHVYTASVMTDKDTGNSRGFGFVVFDSSDDVDELCSTYCLLPIQQTFDSLFIYCFTS